jgi:ATP-dependent Clp protease ATP-binding subunit ClpC
VDSIIVFRQLNQADIRKIVDIVVNEVNERLVEHELRLATTDEACNWLAQHGYDPEFGARPLRRLIQTEVEDRLSDAVLSGRFELGDTILVVVVVDKLVLKPGSGGTEREIAGAEALPAA